MSESNPTSFSTDAGDGYVEVDGLILGGSSITPDELRQYAITTQMIDAGTAQSRWVVAPHAGEIVAAYAVNSVANTTTKTVLTMEIAGTLVTAPAWEIAATQAVGVVSSTVPTSANVVVAGQSIEIISDGGTDATMPVSFAIVIAR